MTTDLAPLAGTVGGGFLLGFVTGYAIKKVIKLAAVIVGLFIAGLAYLEYQRILSVDWHKVQAVSQNGIDWLADALTHVSSTIGASHPGTVSNIGIPLVSSVSVGFVFWDRIGDSSITHPTLIKVGVHVL
jgi:uncharacterized membrane protein (Fun14 family)